jgi:sugar O-acyltransferase (sialic acid O-acetyltransferase NeuD family)
VIKQKLVLVGAGGHARSCIDVIEQQGRYRIIGLVGSINEVGCQVLGYKVLGTDDALPEILNRADYSLIAVGQIEVNEIRNNLFSRIANIGFKSPIVVSPRAYVSPHADIGFGTIVMHGATVNAGARIGNNCIINSQALIEHDVIVEDDCHIATGATINGGATVGQFSFVGSRSTIRESITIGQMCLIGMNLSVRHDLPPNSRFLGK